MPMQHDAIHARFAHINKSWVRNAMSHIEESTAYLKSFDHLVRMQERTEAEIIKLCVEAEGRLRSLLEHLETLEDYLDLRDRATTDAERNAAVESHGSAFGMIIQEIRGFDKALQKIQTKEGELDHAGLANVHSVRRIKDIILGLKKAERTQVTQMLQDLKLDRSDFDKVFEELDW